MYPQANPPWRFAATLLIAARTAFKPATSFDYKLLLMRRNAESSFMPNVHVFPGGSVDNSDFSNRWTHLFRKSGHDIDLLNNELCSRNRPSILSTRFYPKSDLSTDLGLRICAIRETFEESGLLVVRDAGNGSRITFNDETIESQDAWRRKVYDDGMHFIDMCDEMNVLPDVWSLSEWANWLTPLGTKATKRFDAIFYIYTPNQLLENMAVSHDDKELVHTEWMSPAEALTGVFSRTFSMGPPQIYETLRVANFRTHRELDTYHRSRAKDGLELLFPVRIQLEDGVLTTLPGDDLYPESPDYVNGENRVLKCKLSDRRSDGKQHRIEVSTNGQRNVFCNINLPYGQSTPLSGENLLGLIHDNSKM